MVIYFPHPGDRYSAYFSPVYIQLRLRVDYTGQKCLRAESRCLTPLGSPSGPTAFANSFGMSKKIAKNLRVQSELASGSKAGTNALATGKKNESLQRLRVPANYALKILLCVDRISKSYSRTYSRKKLVGAIT